MKYLKKLFVVLFVAFATLLVVGCEQTKEVDLYEEFKSIAVVYDKKEISEDITLPSSKGDIQITWTSQNPDVVSNTGVVTRQNEDVTVRLIAIFKYGEKTESFFLDVIVKAKELAEDDFDKISSIVAGQSYLIKGVVVAVNAQSFLVGDDTGYILVYKGYNYAKDLVGGDIVTVKGTTTTYGGALQFDSTAEYEKVDSQSIEGLAITPLTVEEINAYADATEITPKLVAIKGKVSTSSSSDGTKTYYNLEITGANIKGSITYPVDGDSVAALSGKDVEVIGYVTGVSGSTAKYLNLMVVSIKEIEVENVPAEQKTIAEIIVSENGLYTTNGVIAAVNAQSFVLVDGDDAILVYMGKDWDCNTCAVGDKVTVTGNTSVYGKAVQFGSIKMIQSTDQIKFTLPTATELDGAKITEIASKEVATIQYVKVTGTLAVSGNYFNVNFEGTEIVGSVTYPTNADIVKSFNGKKVVIEGYYTGLVSDKYFNLMVTSIVEKEVEVEPAVEKTISEVLAAETGASYVTTGAVVAVNAQGFIIADDNAAMLVYQGKNWVCDVVVGDRVEVTGVTTIYSKAIQFGTDATYEKVGSEEVTAPTPVVVDGVKINELAALDSVTIQYVKVEGVLSISGNYYNVTFNGTTVQGSITYPVDTETLTAYDGKGITVEGYFTGITVSSSAGKTFFNIVGVKYSDSDVVIEQPEPNPNPNPNPTDSVVYDFVTNFSTYAKSWDTSYKERVVNSSDLGTGLLDAKFIFSRADKQNAGQKIDDRPVIAAGKSDLTAYLTVEANFTGFNTISFDLKQWNTKTFTDIHIEYTTDGTTWVKCSDVITTPGVLTNNASFEGATKIRISITTNNSGSNVQLGLSSITLGK